MKPPNFGEEELRAVAAVLAGGELSRGAAGKSAVDQLEADVARLLGRRFVYAVNSGTSANEACVAALGLAPGDEVICPAAAPIFVSLPVLAAGAIPVFADVDARSLHLTVETVLPRITERTRAIVVVHLGGQPAPIDAIVELARARGLAVIEDCAQALGSRTRGRLVGTVGDLACFSLQQSKHVNAGEGGLVATDDPERYRRAVLYSNAGMATFGFGLPRPGPRVVAGVLTRVHLAFGHNHRMSALHAAVGRAQLAKLDESNRRRDALAAIVREELAAAPGVLLPVEDAACEVHPWSVVVQLDPAQVKLPAAEVVRRCWATARIGPMPYCEINYLEPVFEELERRRQTPFGLALPEHVRYRPGACPIAEEAARRTLLILTPQGADPDEIRRLARAIRTVVTAPA